MRLPCRLKAGTYIAPPVRRAYVPKEQYELVWECLLP